MLYLVTKEIFGFDTIFDALDLGSGGVGRARITTIEDPAIPEISAAWSIVWSEERPLDPRHVAAFLGPPESDRDPIFFSLLVDENITSFADFVEYGYAIYELAPGGDLIRLGADGAPMLGSGGTQPPEGPAPPDETEPPDTTQPPSEVAPPAALETQDPGEVFDFDILSGVSGASFMQVMTGPFSFIADLQLGLSSLNEIDGATIAVIPGSEIEAALNTLARELNLSYEPVFVESIEQAVVSFQAGISDLFVYPTRLIDESGLSGIAGQFSLLEGTFGTSTPPVLPSVAFDTVEFATDRNNTAFDGTSGNDYLAGLRGDDRIFGGGGDDWIIGGPGLDVARYSGAQSSYSLTLGPTGTYLSDRRASGDGTDRLIDVELIEFASTAQGDPFDLRIFGGPAGLSQSELQSFVELYIAYFNRAPDAIGLNFWGTAFANGTSLDQIAALFIDQAETRLLYPETLTNDAFVLAVYANVLGRLPDDAGYNFWRATLDSATVTRDTFILEILRGAKADPQDVDVAFIQQQTIDRNYLENKTDLGIYFAVTLGMSNVSNASAVMATFGASQQQTLSTAIAAANAFHAAALDPVAGEFLMPLVGVIENPFPQV